MRPFFPQPLTIAILGVLVVGNVSLTLESTAADATPNEADTFYLKEVKTPLRERCFSCHGVLQQKGGLRLDTAEFIRRGGEGGPAVIVGQPDQSELIARVTSTDPSIRMPPEGHALSADEIEQLKHWITQGAIGAAQDPPETDPLEHWAFRAPVKPPLPVRPSGEVVANPIDAFILARLDQAGLTPRPLAEKATLLRRVTIDLIGVPPTPSELREFLADGSPDAYEKAVDRLLDDPRHGERWARHWMDVWRYADWHGRRYVPDNWNSAPQIWRWRDWIVNSLNSDHGYDRMVREMLAGDEVAADDPSATVATGFLIRNWYALNPNDWMRSNVEHTGKAFLGLTFNCAHCHDHKYDPITQDDYFRLRAFFEPINIRQDRIPGEADPGPFQEYSYGVLRKIQRLGKIQVFDKHPDATTWFYTGGDERNRVKERGSIAPGAPTFLGGNSLKIEPVTLPLSSWNPGTRPEMIETLLADQQAVITSSEQALNLARTEVSTVLPSLQEALKVAEQEFADAKSPLEASEASDQTGVLHGHQSLLINAATGRRMIMNSITGLTSLETGTTVSFQVRIIQEAHFNFQLARDLSQGLTASFVGFEQGQIKAYQPGTFAEFAAGTYHLSNGQNRFAVSMELDLPADRCLLTVRSLSDDTLLVDKVPIALNGWNPVGNPQKGILLDGRPGSITAFDDFQLCGPVNESGERTILREFQFEPPIYTDLSEIAGTDGWRSASYSVSPATSQVVASIGNDALLAASLKVQAARRALAAQELRVSSAEARIAAAHAEIRSIQARLAADIAKDKPDDNAESLIATASQLSREAARLRAWADVQTSDQALAAAESKPMSDSTRAAEVEAAAKPLAAAREAFSLASAASTDPALSATYPPLGPIYPNTSTGRRRALAQWITSRDNPLAARVAINHLWMRHFHVPLVSSVYDFGRNGAAPTHPELLDWLAVELMDSGWSMKHIHRLIVTSEAYRRISSAGHVDQTLDNSLVDASSGATAFAPSATPAPRPGMEALSVDPENKLLWRMNTGRMEAEVVRDSLLAVAGRLDLTMGGQELENSEALTTWRRTLYYCCQPEIDGKSELGALFDAPESTDCYRRTRSVIPQQSLALTNSNLVHELSEQIAKEVTADQTHIDAGQSDSDFINRLFERILSRSPTAAERAVCLDALVQWRSSLSGPASAEDNQKVRASMARVLLNHNDFITVR